MRYWLLFSWLVLISSLTFGGTIQQYHMAIIGQEQSSAVSCNTSTDYIGDKNVTTDTDTDSGHDTSSEITGNATGWYSASISASVSCGTNYWVFFDPASTNWYHNYDSAGSATLYYKSDPGFYETPQDPLDSTGWSTAAWDTGIYVTIGP